MKICGIVVEYNPLHNGHLYHINKTRALSNCDLLVAVMSGNFVQRGEPAILNKDIRTELALAGGVDVVVLLPYFYALGNADHFAYGAIKILNEMGVQEIYFGSESDDYETLEKLAYLIGTIEFDILVKEQLHKGNSYAYACAEAIKQLTNDDITLNSNDLLGIQYIRNCLRVNNTIKLKTIKRIHNNYNDIEFTHESIASATSIRLALQKNKDISQYVPQSTKEAITSHKLLTWDDFYEHLLYQIYCNKEHLHQIHDVNEGIENAIYKEALKQLPFEEFVAKLVSKRYTNSHIKRILTHILNNITKEDIKEYKKGPPFIKILGLNEAASPYLKMIKKTASIPIITNVNRKNYHLMELEERIDRIYHLKLCNKSRLIPVIKSY